MQGFLRENALAEPLFNRWYAWLYLVSPVTAPMYVGNLHLRLMESFLANPQVHVAALKNPAMLGVYVYAMGSEPWLTYLTSIHCSEQSRPIVQSRALVEECWLLGVPAGTLFGKKEVVFQ